MPNADGEAPCSPEVKCAGSFIPETLRRLVSRPSCDRDIIRTRHICLCVGIATLLDVHTLASCHFASPHPLGRANQSVGSPAEVR